MWFCASVFCPSTEIVFFGWNSAVNGETCWSYLKYIGLFAAKTIKFLVSHSLAWLHFGQGQRYGSEMQKCFNRFLATTPLQIYFK